MDRKLITTEFTPGSSRRAAELELVWFDEELGKNTYVSLYGKKAKKLQHLTRGDTYHEEVVETPGD